MKIKETVIEMMDGDHHNRSIEEIKIIVDKMRSEELEEYIQYNSQVVSDYGGK